MRKDKPINIEAKIKAEKIFRFALISYTILWLIAGIIVIMNYTGDRMAMFIFFAYPLVFGVPIYFGVYLPYSRSTKWLHSLPCEVHAEIQEGKFLFSKRPYAILPYSQVAWVFIETLPIGGVIVINCRDGRRLRIERDYSSLYNKATSEIPGLIIGNGRAQKKQYLSSNPGAKAKHNFKQRIWGIVLLILFFVFLSMSIYNKAIEPMGVVMLISLLIGSFWLFWSTFKN